MEKQVKLFGSKDIFKECVGCLLSFDWCAPGMCGAELFPAGRGEDKNPRGGAKVKIRGAGQKNA